jgi:hypothetical protein
MNRTRSQEEARFAERLGAQGPGKQTLRARSLPPMLALTMYRKVDLNMEMM